MELDDNEFDAAFRERVFGADPQFEEAAWDKMEGKLRRRERIVLFRKGSVVLSLLLLIGLVGYYSFDKKTTGKARTELAGAGKRGADRAKVLLPIDTTVLSNDTLAPQKSNIRSENQNAGLLVGNRNQSLVPAYEDKRLEHNKAYLNRNLPALPQPPALSLPLYSGLTDKQTELLTGNNQMTTVADKHEKGLAKLKIKPVIKKSIPMSLALSAGPEFNSAGSLIGGKGGFSAGLTFSMGIAKNFRLQTGLKYSAKDYATDSYAYRFNNPQFQGMVSGIDASCAVLEIPVIASYTVMEDRQRSVDLNLGLSSYLMLKEDYTFRYTQESGMSNRLVEKRNANQHLLSVVDLSATYFIKLKTEKFRIGVEPFVKIPLTGVGEGRVNLKSSGVSLKIRYDLNK